MISPRPRRVLAILWWRRIYQAALRRRFPHVAAEAGYTSGFHSRWIGQFLSGSLSRFRLLFRRDIGLCYFFHNSILIDKKPVGLSCCSLLSQFLQAVRIRSFETASQGNSNHIYVHSKLMIVDDEWFTLGSANFVDISWKKDHTELNFAVWDPTVASQLRRDLFAEHGLVDPDLPIGTTKQLPILRSLQRP